MSKKPNKSFFKKKTVNHSKESRKRNYKEHQKIIISSQSSLFKDANAGDVLLGDSMHKT